MVILEFIGGLGEVMVSITPMTLVFGIINAIKKMQELQQHTK